MRRRVAQGAAALTLIGGLTACGGDDGGAGDGGSDDPVVVEITFADGEVSPVGEVVELEAGQPIDLEVTAEEPGELHVHTEEEQTFAYDAGTNVFKFEVARPGKVEVESHELDQVIVQLIVQ